MGDLTHVHVGFDGMLRFFVKIHLLILIFIVNGAEEHLSTSSMNRVFCVWVRTISQQPADTSGGGSVLDFLC